MNDEKVAEWKKKREMAVINYDNLRGLQLWILKKINNNNHNEAWTPPRKNNYLRWSRIWLNSKINFYNNYDNNELKEINIIVLK